MTDIILGTIILAMIAERAYMAYESRKQQREYIKAILAKNLSELTQSDITDKVNPNIEPEPSEFIPLESADDSLFKRALERINGKEN